MDGTNSPLSRKITETVVFIYGFLLLVSPTTLAPFDVLSVLLVAGSLFVFLLNPKFRASILSREPLAIIGLGTLVLLSYIFIPESVDQFGVLSLYVISLYVVGRFILHNSLRETLFAGYRIGAFAAALLGVVVMIFFQNTDLATHVTQGGRLSVFFSDPNVFGAFLIPALLLSVGHLFKEVHRDTTNLIIHSFFSIILLLALLFTESRGVYIGAIVGLFVLLISIRTQSIAYRTKLLSITAGIAATSLLFILYIGDHNVIGGSMEHSITPRMETAAFGITLLGDRDTRTLMIGSGNGSYESLSPDNLPAQNTYLRILIENGLLGFGLLTLFLSFLAYRLFHERDKDLYTQVLIASLCVLLVQSTFIDTLHWRHAFLLLGLL